MPIAWSEPPEDSLTRALIEKLLSTGAFSDVGLSGDTSIPDFLIQGEITEFREDRSESGAMAVCTLKLDVRERDSGRLAHYGVFTEATPVSGGNVAELDAALETSARAVLDEAYAAIDGAIKNME